jgi:CheY-like chemotaxis protein
MSERIAGTWKTAEEFRFGCPSRMQQQLDKLLSGGLVMSALVSEIHRLELEASSERQRGFRSLPRILLVEDDKALRDVLLLILFSAGYDCREAADGRAAIDLLASGIRINLVLSNMLLDRVDGFTLFIHVRHNYPSIPFVFVTGVNDAQVREVAMREGAAGYLLKPFEVEEFLTTVRRALIR